MISPEKALAKISLFEKFSKEELENILKEADVKTYKPKEVIIQEGSSGACLYFILEGEVRVFKSTPEGYQLTLTILKEGDFFGELSFFDRQPRSASVQSLGPATLLSLYPETFIDKLEDHPDILFKMLVSLSLRFRSFDTKYYNKIRKRNKALEDAFKVLKQVYNLKSKFISIASHELRTPLASSLLALDALKNIDDKNLTEDQSFLFKTLTTNTKRLIKIVNTLIKLCLDKNADFELQKIPTPISLIIDEVRLEIEPYIHKRQLELDIYTEKDLPEAPVNREMIRQAIYNLAINAIRFTPDGGKIKIYAQKRDGGIEVGVKDTGIGIGEDQIPNIFESFYEGIDSDKHHTGTFQFSSSGLGSGLTIAKNFIEMHGSNLKVESTPKAGSDFHFHLSIK